MAEHSDRTSDAVICLVGFFFGAAAASILVEPNARALEAPEKIEWLFDGSEEMKCQNGETNDQSPKMEGMK